MSDISARIDQLSLLKRSLLRIQALEAEIAALKDAKSEPIAVIGMSCRFPGANSPEAFWRLLRDGVDAIREVPSDRWDVDEFYDPNAGTPGKMTTRWGGFLDQCDQFDPQFFGISPREAARMDPQQRLLLEVVWEALEDAGQSPKNLVNSQTGVFIGVSSNDYSILQHGELGHIDAYTGTGNALCITANRLSYMFDFRGPSIAVDTACSSSLVSVHLACQSLRKGEANLALAGGVNLILSPELSITFSHAHMMASDGRCKTFDASADGYVRGEGCGVVVLKRLSEALKDGDNLLAVIRGSAVNQDGRSNGLTAPNGLAQQQVIQEALKDAHLTPDQIDYIEAHGTGTILGDPIEVRALGAVIAGRPEGRPCLLGSVKTNIGHLEAAAGIAGLIKVVLSLKHGEIPPHLHFKQVNPHIPLDQLPLSIPTELRPWPAGEKTHYAGVSSFGFGGANAHVVLGEAPKPVPVKNDLERPAHLLSLSGKSELALQETVKRYENFLSQHPQTSLANICFTANTGRSHFDHRLAIAAQSAAQLKESLAAFLEGQALPSLHSGHTRRMEQPKVAFLFTGQGAQYPGMGRQLYDTQPTFRRALDRCADILDGYLEQPLFSVIFPENESASPVHETAYTQPALFALEYALAQLWISWGVRPDYVLGHSVGEYVAACIAGVFSLEDGLKLIAERGRLMQSLPHDGDMAVVFADRTQVTASLIPYQKQVTIAAVNGPNNVVISGKKEAVHAIRTQLEMEGVVTRSLAVSHAFHSPLMDPILDQFAYTAERVQYHEPSIPIISNLTGRVLEAGDIPDAHYWRNHIREAVQFDAGMQALAERGCEIFIEAGPNPTLLGMGKRCLPDLSGLWLPSLKKGQEDWDTLLDSLAAIYSAGYEVDWSDFDRDYTRHLVELPTYPFQRERYWFDLLTSSGGSQARPKHYLNRDGRSHPLLGRRLPSPLKIVQFESQVSGQTHPYLQDFRIQDVAVMPASAYLEMALAAAFETMETRGTVLEDISFPQMLLIPDDTPHNLQLALTPGEAGETSFEIFGKCSSEEQDANWSLHSVGKIRQGPGEVSSQPRVSLDEIRDRCREVISAEMHERLLRDRGIHRGSHFQIVDQLWRGNLEALVGLKFPPDLGGDGKGYHIHPALMEGCFQALMVTWASLEHETDSGHTYLPSSVNSLRVYAYPGSQLWSHVVLHPPADGAEDSFTGDVRLIDAGGGVIVEALGLRFCRLNAEAQQALRKRPKIHSLQEKSEAQVSPAYKEIEPETILAAGTEERRELLETYLRLQLSRVLSLDPVRIDLYQPINYLGLDSIMAIELKNSVERSLNVNLPISSLLQGPSISQLASQLADLLASPGPAEGMTAAQVAAGVYPLSQGQRAMWFQHQIAPASIFNPVYAVRIRSAVDVSTFRAAFQTLVDRHPVLRTAFTSRNGDLVQIVHERAEVYFHHEDASTWSAEALQARLEREAERIFDLEQGPLLRIYLFSLSETEHILMLAAHHIVVDLWSLALLISELYTIFSSPDGAQSLPPLKFQYTDYIHWQSEMLAGPEEDRLWEYWRNNLGGELPVLDLPSDRPRPPLQTHCGASQALRLDPELTRQLEELSERYGTTLFMTLLAAFKVLLYRYSGQEDLIVGTPTTGRSRMEMSDVVGYFVNSVALRTHLSPDLKFSELMHQVRQTVVGAIDHQDYPFSLLVEKLKPERDPSRLPLFQVMFILQRAHLLYDEGLSKFAVGMDGLSMNLAGLALESVTVEQHLAAFDLTLMMAEADGGLIASMNYNTDLYDEDTITRMLGHLKVLLEGVVSNAEQHLWELPLLTEVERRQLLVEWNATSANYPLDRCVHQIFEGQVKLRPQKIALTFEDESLTYEELNCQANMLARYLRKFGVGPETIVGICEERSLERVVGLLGILKAGGAYLPLDPRYPKDRLDSMLKDSRVPVLLTQEGLLAVLPETSSRIICLDRDWPLIALENGDDFESGVSARNLAYMIYTSGSTGTPKGVLLEHRGLTNLVKSQTEAFGVHDDCRVLQFASFSFDASVSEVFMALLTGATLYLARQETLASLADLHNLLKEKRITTVTLPPSLLAMLPPEGLPDLHTVISAGDSCSPEIAAHWAPGRRFFNAYGPTEATIGPTLCLIEDLPAGTISVPIGRPIANTQVYILDPRLNPVPIGIPGEIYIGGVGVARGYLNRPELTAKRFVRNPFRNEGIRRKDEDDKLQEADGSSSISIRHSEFLYRTGDLACFLPDGNIEFQGRVDHQVKIRGFRIELGEIEAVLGQHPQIRQAVVISRENGSGDKRLVAYLVPKNGNTPSVNELRGLILEKLPEYMVPSQFISLKSLPMTPSGKLDRKGLPAPENNRPDLDVAYAMPQSELERNLASVWQELLKLDKVGVNDNFFDLGGHSLLITKAHIRLQEILGREISMVELFRYPTIRTLAEYLNQQGNEDNSMQKSLAQADRQRTAVMRQSERMRAIAQKRVARPRPNGPPEATKWV